MIVNNFEEDHKKTLVEISNLETTLNQIQTNDDFQKNKPNLEKTAKHFDELLNHFKKEEVVFDKLEEKGVSGPVEVMREEHDEMKEKAQEFATLVKNKKPGDEELNKLKYTAKYLMEMIKSHIEKEEMIIYPLCMEKLSEEDWKECEEKAEAKE